MPNLEIRASRNRTPQLQPRPDFSGGLNRALVTLQSERAATLVELEARDLFDVYTLAAWSNPPQTEIARKLERDFFHSDTPEVGGDSAELVSIQYLAGNIQISMESDTPYKETLLLALKRSEEIKQLKAELDTSLPNAQQLWNEYIREFQFLKVYSALALAFHLKDRRFINKLWTSRSPNIPAMPIREKFVAPVPQPVEPVAPLVEPEADLSDIIPAMLFRRGEPILVRSTPDPIPLPPTRESAPQGRRKKSKYSYEELLGDAFDGNAVADLLHATQAIIKQHKKDLQGYEREPILLLNHLAELLDQNELLVMLKNTFDRNINPKSIRRLALVLKAIEKVYLGSHEHTMDMLTKQAESIQRRTAIALIPSHKQETVVFAAPNDPPELTRRGARIQQETPRSIRFPSTEQQIHDALIQAFKDIDDALVNENMGPIQGSVDHRQLAKMHNGLNRTMLQYYADTGIVSPDYEGNTFHYGKVRVAQLFMLARYRPIDNGGITPQDLKRAMKKIRNMYGKTRSEYGRMKERQKRART